MRSNAIRISTERELSWSITRNVAATVSAVIFGERIYPLRFGFSKELVETTLSVFRDAVEGLSGCPAECLAECQVCPDPCEPSIVSPLF